MLRRKRQKTEQGVEANVELKESDESPSPLEFELERPSVVRDKSSQKCSAADLTSAETTSCQAACIPMLSQ